jgi:transforming growth factor-beta-induced protein
MLRIVSSLILAGLFSSPVHGRELQSNLTLLAVAAATDDLSSLVAAVQAVNYTEALNGTSPITVFAPANSAFDDVPSDVLAKLMSDAFKPHLKDVLQFHTYTGGAVSAADITNGQNLTMSNGENITFAVGSDGSVSITPAVRGGSASVVIPNVQAANGIAHVISTILAPTSITYSVLDALSSYPGLESLVQLVQFSGSAVTLTADDAAYTVFAPTDEAFSSVFNTLGEDAVAYLTSPEGLSLVKTILGYHVVPGVYSSEMLAATNGTVELETLSGYPINVTYSNGQVTVNGNATVIEADILNTGGVVHVLDGVLVPPIDIMAIIAGNETLSNSTTDETTDSPSTSTTAGGSGTGASGGSSSGSTNDTGSETDKSAGSGGMRNMAAVVVSSIGALTTWTMMM